MDLTAWLTGAEPQAKRPVEPVLAAVLQATIFAKDLLYFIQKPESVIDILLSGHWIDRTPNIVHQPQHLHPFNRIYYHRIFIHAEMYHPSSEKMPMTVFTEWMVPLQATFQV